MQSKLLSVVIPAYNSASFIGKLFKKVPFDQLHEEIEFVVINDGSKDDTWQVLQTIQTQYGKNYVRIYNKENGGWGSVHNFAKHIPLYGKYTKTLDSDDYFDPYALLKFLEFLKNLPDDIDIIFSNVNFINMEDEIMTQKFYDSIFPTDFFKIDEITFTKFSVLNIHTFTTLTKIYQSIPDLPVHMSYMDSVLIFLLVNACTHKCAFFKDAPLYQYQVGNVSQSISIQNLAKHADWLQKVIVTQANYFNSLQMATKNSKKKNMNLGQMMQLSYFLYCYGIVNKADLNNREKARLMYQELKEIKSILGVNYDKYFADFTINLIKFLHCKLLPNIINLAAMVINTGYLKATKKDGKWLNGGMMVQKKNKQSN